MTWEIVEPRCTPGLLDIQFNNDILEWDFPLNSPNNLCAIFFYEPNYQLVDYKRDRARPILYHKNLKTFRNTANDPSAKSYCLYPARIENGTLFIEDCANNPISKDSSTFTVNIIKQKRFLFLRWTCQKKVICSLQGISPRACLYYRIFKNGHAIEKTFSIPLLEKFASIRLARGESIYFYENTLFDHEVGKYEA